MSRRPADFDFDAAIGLLTARFRSPATERAFQAFSHARYLRMNMFGVGFGVFMFAVFAFSDYVNLENPRPALIIRGSITAVSLMLLSLLTIKRVARGQEYVFAAIAILLSVGLNLIIALEATIQNKHYIGLIQGAVLFGLILRINFLKSAAVFGASFFTFVAVAFSKANLDVAMVRAASLGVICLICIAGVYFLQRYHRRDFMQARIIERQNAKLSAMLTDLQQDNERKIATLNLLVHFVRTPIHQIAGFTDVVASMLSDVAKAGTARSDEQASADDGSDVDGSTLDASTIGRTTAEQTIPDGPSADEAQAAVEKARASASYLDYIKTAADDLIRNVTQLLDYHRLEETDRHSAPEPLDFRELVRDAFDGLEGDERVKVDATTASVATRAEPARLALRSAARHAQAVLDGQNGEAAARGVSITSYPLPDGVALVIDVDGVDYAHEQFMEEARPLPEVTRYLTANGSSMPMDIRIMARVGALAGGALEHEGRADGYSLRLILPNAAEEASLAAANDAAAPQDGTARAASLSVG